jgi:Phosphatidylserine decarboxylase
MEVGALMVGKIVNHRESCFVLRGEEKGYFEFGGSTIVLLLEKDAVTLREDLLVNTLSGYETQLRLGNIIGKSNKWN